MRSDTLRLVDECPTVVGMITATVGSGGSLDSAIRAVAEDGPAHSRRLFSRAVPSPPRSPPCPSAPPGTGTP